MAMRRPGRPRLVEEGTPLTDSLDSDDDDENESGAWDKDMEVDHDHSNIVARRNSARQPPSTCGASSSSSSSPSSLLKALGGKAPPSSSVLPKRSMRIEIGGGETQERRVRVGSSAGQTRQPNWDEGRMEWDDGQQNHNVHRPHDYDYHHHQHQQQTAYSYQIPPINNSQATSASHHAHAAAAAAASPATATPTIRTHYEVGADYRPTERMEGVEDHSVPLPLVVLDGANVAYAYAHARQEHFHGSGGRVEPDVRGLDVACAFFGTACRVRAVLPASFVRAKPRAGDASRTNAWMETDRFEILQQLQRQGKLVAAPPKDDDDAYCLTIAQRENLRALQTRQGQGPAFVLSNDMFRDAQERDTSGRLKDWLINGDRQETGPGRISYTFVDLDRKDDHGDPIFDFVPNPRHPLIAWVEESQPEKGASV